MGDSGGLLLLNASLELQDELPRSLEDRNFEEVADWLLARHSSEILAELRAQNNEATLDHLPRAGWVHFMYEDPSGRMALVDYCEPVPEIRKLASQVFWWCPPIAD